MMTVILTGGKSRRMGRDKALLETGQGAMSLMLARRYAPVLGPVAFAVDEAGRFDCGEFTELPDAFPGCGPMNGLYSAFTRTGEDYVFLTATDMPCGDPSLAEHLLRSMGDSDICTIVHPNGHIEPLFSVYHRRCLPTAEAALRAGKHSLMELFDRHPVTKLPAETLTRWDLEQILTNVNTPGDYRRYKETHPV